MTEVTCGTVIKACDKALLAKQQEIKATQDALDAQTKVSVATQVQLKSAQGKLSSPVRSPIVLVGAGVLGLALGPVTAGVALLGGLVLALTN